MAAPTLETASTGAPTPAGARRPGTAIALALFSSAAFGIAGPFAKSLFATGWSPAAALLARVGVAALVLAVPTVVELRGRWGLLRHQARDVALYGLFGVAGCQLFYFLAVQHLSVGVALLLEYLSPTLLVLFAWFRSRQAPSRTTAVGILLSLLGLVLVLDVLGGVRVDLVGVLFGLAAAVCSATYFLVASDAPHDGLSPLALAGSGMAVGILPLLVLAGTGVLPVHASTAPVDLAGWHAPYLVPVLGLSLVAAVLAYWTSGASARMLGSRVASFLALAEVLFAILFAALFLGEVPAPVQWIGGALIVAGVVLVRAAERGSAPAG